ncbi:MAG TPA: hypothetical protein VH500_07400 [Nitrososphaeraceae archaeon]|jgi:hypothetical protein
MKIASLTRNVCGIALDKKTNNIADTFGKYLNKSSYNIYRTIKYSALFTVLMGALLVHAVPGTHAITIKDLPFWLPFNLPHDAPLKYFHVILHHVRPEMNLISVCITDTNSTLGLCHYMNTTQEENQFADDDIEADAGIFAFPPNTFPVNDTLQLCVKSIFMHIENCIWDKNDAPDTVTRYGADMSDFRPAAGLIQRPEIMDHMNFGGGIV